MYFRLSDKKNQEKLKVDDCQKCGHPTLQMEQLKNSYSTGRYQCLNCGSILSLEYVLKGGVNAGHD